MRTCVCTAALLVAFGFSTPSAANDQGLFPSLVEENTTGFADFFFTGSPDDMYFGIGGKIVTLDFGRWAVIENEPGSDFNVYEVDSGVPEFDKIDVLVSEDGTEFVSVKSSESAIDRVCGDGKHNNNLFARSYDLDAAGVGYARYVRIDGEGNGAAGCNTGFDLDAIGAIHHTGCIEYFVDGIFFPDADTAFADTVLSYIPGDGVGAPYNNPERALGEVDSTYTSLGSEGGSMIVGFSNNLLAPSFSNAPDLAIFEVGDSSGALGCNAINESVSVFIRPIDTGLFIPVGETRGGTDTIDIDTFDLHGYTLFDAVKLVSLDTYECCYPTEGPDINAVAAITRPQVGGEQLYITLIRGFNPEEAGGINILAEKIAKHPRFRERAHIRIFNAQACLEPNMDILRFIECEGFGGQDYLVLIGHSFGGNMAYLVANGEFELNGVLVDGLIAIDPIDWDLCPFECNQSGEERSVPFDVPFVDYVQREDNFFQGYFVGGEVSTTRQEAKYLSNKNFVVPCRGTPAFCHTTIDGDTRVHRAIIAILKDFVP